MPSPPLRRSAIRILAVNSLVIALFLLHVNIDVPSSINVDTAIEAGPRTPSAVAFSRSSSSLSSGVGLVTTDGAWEELEEEEIMMIDGERGDISDVKILGFTDRNYLPIAMLWYGRLTVLVRVYSKCKQNCIVTSFLTSLICTFLHISHVQGYTEHYIVAHDE